MSADPENVLQQCYNLLEDIRIYKGIYLYPIHPDSGSDLPTAPEHTKGDDIWTFYRSVQTERSAIEKVPLIILRR
jgi:hypothetical protein